MNNINDMNNIDIQIDNLTYNIYNNLTLNNEYELNKSDPDYYIENFWYGLKKSMINFYIQNDLSYNHIYDWSNNLNKLKIDKQYDSIQYFIREYISSYSKDIMNNSFNDTYKSYYDDEILITNIKRWNKISLYFNFEKSVKHNNIFILFLIFLEIKRCRIHIDDNINFINNINKHYTIDTIIINNRYDDFIIYALNYNKCKILDLLKVILNYKLYERIIILFPKIKFYKNINVLTKMNKICKIYKKIYD